MIKDPIKFKVGKMQVDVNWSKAVTPCKKIRFKFGGETQILDHDDVYAMLMLFGNDKQQEALIPVTRTEMVLIERMLHVKATKDIKAGELITVPYRYSITEEAYKEAIKKNPRSYRKIVDDKSVPVV